LPNPSGEALLLYGRFAYIILDNQNQKINSTNIKTQEVFSLKTHFDLVRKISFYSEKSFGIIYKLRLRERTQTQIFCILPSNLKNPYDPEKSLNQKKKSRQN